MSKSNVYLKVNEVIDLSVICDDLPINNSFTHPPLPTGITLSKKGLFSGSSKIHFFNTTYYVGVTDSKNMVRNTVFSLSIIDAVTRCEYGNRNMVLYKDQKVKLSPPRCNGPIYRYGISPDLPTGLSLDQYTGSISGTPTITKPEVTYHLTPYTMDETERTIVIIFKLRIDIPKKLPSGLYNRITPDGYCGSVQNYNIWKLFDTGEIPISSEGIIPCPWGVCEVSGCNWEFNINHGHQINFCMKAIGYIEIKNEGDYEFRLDADDSAYLFLIDLETPLLFSNSSIVGISNKINLKVGYHRFGVLYQQTIDAFYLKVEWKSTAISKNDFVRIPQESFSYDPIPVQHLTYRSTYITFPIDIFTEFIPTYIGTANNFIMNGTLPSGITFSKVNGSLYGIPTESIGWTELYITGESIESGSSTTLLNIRVVEIKRTTLKQRVPTSIYKPYIINCNSKIDEYDGFHHLAFDYYRDRINTPYNLEPIPEILPNYKVSLILKFHGVMFIPSTGRYTFRLRSIDGSVFILNHKNILENFGCSIQEIYFDNSTTFELDVGYYNYQLYYSRMNDYTYKYGVKLYYTPPGSAEVEFPSAYLFYLPLSSFDYTYNTQELRLNRETEDNLPFVFDLPIQKSITKYSIFPNLPTGLGMDPSTGQISGMPARDVKQSKTEYYIWGETTDGTFYVSTVISLLIIASGGPSEFRCRYLNDTSAFLLYGKVGEEITKIRCLTASVGVIFVVTNGSLPLGVTIDSIEGIISGIPQEPMTSSIVLVASNTMGVATYNIKILIEPCDESKSYIFFQLTTSDSNVNVKLSSDQTYIDENINEIYKTITFGKCINNEMNLKLNIISKAYRPPLLLIKYPDNSYLLNNYISSYDGITDVTFDLDIPLNITLPTLKFENLPIIYSDVYIQFSGIITGSINEISIDPPLPSGLTLSLPAFISGRPRYISDIKTYTVTFSNSLSGKLTTTFSLSVIKCNGTNVPIEILIRSQDDGSNMKIKLEDNTKKYIDYSGFKNNVLSTYSLCIPIGNYKFTIGSNNDKSWTSLSSVQINYIHGIEIFSKSYKNSTKSEYSVDILHIIGIDYPWHYLDTTNPPSNWNKIELTDLSEWLYNSTGFYNSRIEITQYYRYKFNSKQHITFNNVNNLILSVQYDSGIIIYLNGNELFRDNLPATVTPTTKGINIYESIVYHRFGLSSQYLLDGDNILAIELHKHDSSSNENIFSAFFDVNEEECSPLPLNSYLNGIIKTKHNDVPGYPVNYLFDDYSNTQWESNLLNDRTTTLTYYYSTQRIENINSYTIVTGDSELKDPISWNLYGSLYYDKDYVLLDKQVNQSYVERQNRLQYYFTNIKSYRYFRWDITEFGDRIGVKSNTIKVADFLLYSCKVKYCATDNSWRSTLIDTTSYRDCDKGFEGKLSRKCNSNGQWGNVEGQCTLKAPGPITINKQEVTTSRRLAIDPITCDCDGKEIEYSIAPELTNGLYFNKTHCIISGIPTDILMRTYYKITAINSKGSSNNGFYLTISTLYCEDLPPWYRVEQGEYANLPCPDGTVGYYRRYCEPSWQPYWRDPERSCRNPDNTNIYLFNLIIVLIIIILL